MPRVELKGLHSVRRRLADGRTATYHYAWRGGPRLEGEPGSPEFLASFAAAGKTRKRPQEGTLQGLIAEFRASADHNRLSASSKRAYAAYIKLIEAEFGDMPIEGLSDPRARGDFKVWRDGMAATPRKADYAWTVLARILSVAKDRGRIAVNPCERGGRLYEADRADLVWTEERLVALFGVASPEVTAVVVAGLWTGQRQGDLLRLAWSAHDGRVIRLRQSKTGRRVTIPVGAPLAAVIAAAPKRGPVMFTSSEGTPWTSDGFRSSFRRACELAGVRGVTFNDLRGTAVTRLAVAGCTEAEIAAITGHSLRDVASILDRHYLSRDVALAENAIRKLERNERKAKRGRHPTARED